MPTTKLTAEQAFAIADQYHELTVNLGRYRIANRNDLTRQQQTNLFDYEWTFTNASQDFTFKGVSLLLSSAEVGEAVESIVRTTESLNNSVRTLNDIRKILKVAAAGATLAGAIISGHPIAIAQAVSDAASAVTG